MNLTVGLNNPNALSRQVAQAIREGGSMTVDGLTPAFPTFTRKQLHQALMNAKDRGWIRLAQRGSSGRFGAAGIWAVGDSAVHPLKTTIAKPPASVWELGRRESCDKWPPAFEGGRVYITPEDDNEELG